MTSYKPRRIGAGGKNALKLNPDMHAKLVGLFRQGNYVSVAADAAGISLNTLKAWLARGQRGDEPYATFASDVRRAMAEHEVEALERLTAASLKDWKAGAWKLERRYPDRWGKSEHQTVEVVPAPEIDMPPEQALARLCAITDSALPGRSHGHEAGESSGARNRGSVGTGGGYESGDCGRAYAEDGETDEGA